MVQSYAPVLKKKRLDLYVAIVILITLSLFAVFCDFMMYLLVFYFGNQLILKFFLSLICFILNFHKFNDINGY